jgi:hypothetical protein
MRFPNWHFYYAAVPVATTALNAAECTWKLHELNVFENPFSISWAVEKERLFSGKAVLV